MSYEKCLEFLISRRSIRKFKNTEVSDEVVLKLLETARYAPSAKNSQPWEFIIIKDHELRRRLARIHPYASPIAGAPLAIAVICDPSKSPTSYIADCANATTYLLLAAHALGLGAVWIQTLRNAEEVRKLLKVPDDKVPVALIALGWPDEKPEPRPRREVSEITYLNYYGEPFTK